MTLFVTIEANLRQFIGAVVQFLSFRQCETPVTYCLCIVADERETAAPFLPAAAALGICSTTARPQPLNPYLNKWSALNDFGDAEIPALLLDWDVFNSQSGELPECQTSIAARQNPPDLYRDLIASSPTARALSSGDRLASSINGGVLASICGKLRECGARTRSLVGLLQPELPGFAAWQVEQFALSIAVGEIGLTCLPNRWNVTPVSPVSDSDVAFFHYNDSIETSRRLKLNLHEPAIVDACLRELASRWPAQARRFKLLYSQAVDLAPLRSLMETEAAPC